MHIIHLVKPATLQAMVGFSKTNTKDKKEYVTGMYKILPYYRNFSVLLYF